MYRKSADLEACTVLLVTYTCISAFGMIAGENVDWHYDGENIAFRKTSFQLPSTYCDNKCYSASLAVDGNTDSNFKHGTCSHTIGKSGYETSWTVELGEPFSITRIVIYNRNGNSGSIPEQGDSDVKIRLKNFMVFGDTHTLIYDSSQTDEYNEQTIRLELDGLRSFSTITILIPRGHGYSDGGHYYLTLCEVKIYAAPRPACSARETDVKHGQAQIYNSGKLINSMYTVGTIIRITCDNTFHPDGPSRLECLTTGKYNNPVPKCLGACEPIIKPNNGHVLPDLLLYAVDSTLRIVCDVGYETHKSDIIHCQSDGNWETPVPTCQRVQCVLPRKPDHGYYSINGKTEIEALFFSTFPYMTEIIGLCNVGYVNNHPQRRICKSDKSWSEQEPVCTPIQCAHPPNVKHVVYVFKNGSKTFPQTEFYYNTTLKVSCTVGYTTTEQLERTCQSNKTWSGKDPSCIAVTCDFPGKFDHGHYVIRSRNTIERSSFSSYLSGKLYFSVSIEAVCDKMYMLKSAYTIRQCTATGIWDGVIPVCNPVMCKWPLRLDNGYYLASNSPTQYGMPYNTTLTAACNKTYKLSDNYRRRRCNEDAVWDNTPADCEAMCVLPSVANGQFLNVLSTEIQLGRTLHFTCDQGFATGLSTDSITCLQNHQWSAIPVCQTELQTTKKVAELQTTKRDAEIQTTKRIVELQPTKRVAELQTTKRVAELKTTKRVAELQTTKRIAELLTMERVADLLTTKRVAELNTTKKALESETKNSVLPYVIQTVVISVAVAAGIIIFIYKWYAK